jgi:hypothetical protein
MFEDAQTQGIIEFSCLCGKRLQAREEHSQRRTQCPACGQLLVIPDRAQETDRSPPTAERDRGSGPVEDTPLDRVFLKEEDVLVTSTRLVVRSRRFAVGGIHSAKVTYRPAKRLVTALLGSVLGWMICMAGVYMYLATYDQDRLNAPELRYRFALSIFVMVSGGLVIVFGFCLAAAARPKYGVVITTSSGQTEVLRDYDPEFPRRVVKAVTSAMTHSR